MLACIWYRQMQLFGDGFLSDVVAVNARENGDFGLWEQVGKLLEGSVGLFSGEWAHTVDKTGESLADSGVVFMLFRIELIPGGVNCVKVFAVVAVLQEFF